MRYLLTTLLSVVIATAWSQSTATTDYFAEGKKAQADKNYELAVEHFKKATTQKPNDGQAWFEMGWCYNELQKYEDAISSLKNAKNLLKDDPKVFFESGYANDYAGKIDVAISDYKTCISLNKNYSGAYRQLANIYFDVDKDYKTALSYYNQYVDYSLESELTNKVWYRKGYSENETGQYEDAILSLQRAIALDNKDAASYDELGYAYYKSGKADDAIEAYNNSKQIEPTSSAYAVGLGDVYRFLKKNTDEALVNYKKAVELNPKSQTGNYGVGWGYNEKANFALAIPYLRKAIELNNRYTVAYVEIGYSLYGLKKYEEALVELDKSLLLQETNTGYYYKGLCHIARKQKIEAQTVYKKMVAINGMDAPALLKKINAMP